MKTSITLNKKDIEEIIAQRFGVGVERVVLSTTMEMVGYGQNEHEEQTIAGVVYDGRSNYRFCPHCGAKMDEKEGEQE